MKILIGSPVKQQSNILKVFLENLEKMDLKGLEVTYYFIDDNTSDESKQLLSDFKKKNDNVIIKSYKDFGYDVSDRYQNSETHNWKKHLIERITTFKDEIIEYAKKEHFDFLFFVDSDIIMNPITIKHLISQNVDIVSEVFWTSWKIGDNLTPQVWLQDESNFYVRDWDKQLSDIEKKQLAKDFIAMLKIPGLYEVGGLGACTLITKNALKYDLSFKCIYNVSFWGEDRHFCIRAASYGLKLYVDTYYPAYHIYRESYLSGVNDYVKNGYNPNTFIYNPLKRKKINSKNIMKAGKMKSKIDNLKTLYKEYSKSKFLKKRVINDEHRITLSMVVHNEADRYLRDMLLHTKKYVDEFVIIDDASTDNTKEIIRDVLSDKKFILIENEYSMFSEEWKLRKKQWDETIKTNPDWILFLDSDEIFEDKIIEKIKYMILNDEVDAYCFRLYDMWKPGYYRDDEYWKAHKVYRPFLIRYQPKFHYKFIKKNQHCGRMPKNVLRLNYINSDIRLKHMGWLKDSDKKAKYERYKKLDQDGKYGCIEQYNSILDSSPNLVKFEE